MCTNIKYKQPRLTTFPWTSMVEIAGAKLSTIFLNNPLQWRITFQSCTLPALQYNFSSNSQREPSGVKHVIPSRLINNSRMKTSLFIACGFLNCPSKSSLDIIWRASLLKVVPCSSMSRSFSSELSVKSCTDKSLLENDSSFIRSNTSSSLPSFSIVSLSLLQNEHKHYISHKKKKSLWWCNRLVGTAPCLKQGACKYKIDYDLFTEAEPYCWPDVLAGRSMITLIDFFNVSN